MRMWTSAAAGLLLLLASGPDDVSAFSLPGVQMTTYKKSEHLPLFVNSLTSAETLLPLDYYKLPFCQVHIMRIFVEVCVVVCCHKCFGVVVAMYESVSMCA